jgi:hypothetical protein
MATGLSRRESAGMTFPTVTEISPQMEPVTPDPFIAGEWRRQTTLPGAGARPQAVLVAAR